MPLAEKRTVRTRQVYDAVFARFIGVAGQHEQYSAEQVKHAVTKLDKQYKPSYVALILRVAKTLLPQGAFPDVKYVNVPRDQINQPTFTREVVDEMVTRSHVLPKEYRAYLALATTYGMRCTELAKVATKDIAGGSIYIKTAKGGRIGKQLIPDEIHDVLAGIDFVPSPDDMLRRVFRHMTSLLGMTIPKGYGWHAIRRALVTELVTADVSEQHIRYFLRWRAQTMADRYTAAGAKLDRAVFEKHPFLPFWKAACKCEEK